MLACVLYRRLWVHCPVLNKQVVVLDAQNIREMDTGLEFQGQCQVHTNFKARLGYMTACLKINPNKGKKSSQAAMYAERVEMVLFLEESFWDQQGSRMENGFGVLQH